MSLPTHGYFYKDGKIVGAGFCNPGWFLTADALRGCVKQAMDAAWYRYGDEFKETEWSKRYDDYFTTAEDLRTFDYLSIFEFKIPRDIAMRDYFDDLSDEEWDAFIESTGQFKKK